MESITDAYADDRFDPSHDERTGYKTSTILCGPIRDAEGNVVGVIQVINKKPTTTTAAAAASTGAVFTQEDEEILSMLTTQAGIAMRNAELFAHSETLQTKFRSLVHTIRTLQSSDRGASSLTFTLTQHAPLIADAERCSIFLVDERAQELLSLQGEANVRIALNGPGIACCVATTGESVNIPDAYQDQRFNQEVDRRTNFRTKAILCMPMKFKEKVRECECVCE